MNNSDYLKEVDVNDPPDPMQLVRMGSAYWESRTLHAAVKFDIFTRLKDCKMSALELARECDADERGMEILLIACTAMRLVKRTNGIYQNSPLANKFMVKGAADYRGNIISMFDSWYTVWENLYDAVKTGKPVSEKQHDRGKEATRSYIMGLHNRALYQGEALANAVCLKGKKQMLDVGGGSGTFSIILCKRNPGLKAAVLDLPQTISIAKEIIEQYQMEDVVSTYEADYLKEPFIRGNDVILLESMIKQEPIQTIRELLKKSYNALAAGGLLIVDDQFLNAEKTGPLLAALIAENQLLQTPGGGAYSAEEIGEIIKEIGFKKLSITPLSPPSPNTSITAIKP